MSRAMGVLAYWLRRIADRIDYQGAPKAMGWWFTFESGEGIRFREDGRGCLLWHRGDYEKAHAESDTAALEEKQRKDLRAMADQLGLPRHLLDPFCGVCGGRLPLSREPFTHECNGTITRYSGR